MQCVAATKFGCKATADCCDSKKCEFEAESSRIGQCKQVRANSMRLQQCLAGWAGPLVGLGAAGALTVQCRALSGLLLPQLALEQPALRSAWPLQCIADTFYGCATNADCCGSSKCQRSKPTDPLGYCQPVSTRAAWDAARSKFFRACREGQAAYPGYRAQGISGVMPPVLGLRSLLTDYIPSRLHKTHALQCISNDKFGCSQAEDDCCSDFMCRANQTSLACK